MTADYVVKKYEVKTGMTLWNARQRCLEVIILPSRMDLYLKFSKMATVIFREYTELVESFGVDESYYETNFYISYWKARRDVMSAENEN